MAKCPHCNEELTPAHVNISKIEWLIAMMVADAEERARKEARREREKFPNLETKRGGE